jgi:hypothetical protein
MTYATIVKIAFAIALTCMALLSCTTPRASWGKGDGMNVSCTGLKSNHLPSNFN